MVIRQSSKSLSKRVRSISALSELQNLDHECLDQKSEIRPNYIGPEFRFDGLSGTEHVQFMRNPNTVTNIRDPWVKTGTKSDWIHGP